VGLRQTVADQAGNNTAYTYDPLNRLKTAVTSGPAASSYSYGYDNSGNRTSVTANGVNTTYTYNAADELTNTGFTYDANGNLTAKPGQTYAYNSLNQTTSITTAGTPIAMAYADIGQGERTSAGANSYLNGLLGMTRQTGGSTLAFTRTPGGSLVSMKFARALTWSRSRRLDPRKMWAWMMLSFATTWANCGPSPCPTSRGLATAGLREHTR
jgi:YD repeat-containing protein